MPAPALRWLAGVMVRDVMAEHPETAGGDLTITEFLRDIALLRRHSAFPLLDQAGQLQGLVTLNRILACPAQGMRRRPCPSLR
jgi:CBS-domain-containing membrane protein